MKLLKSIKDLFSITHHLKSLEYNILYNLKKNLLEDKVINDINKGIKEGLYVDHQIIVSLTTYGKRLNEVYLTIESIFQQTYKANKVVLWLEDDLKNIDLPETLKKQINRGLEVKFYKDIRSYKKLIPSLIEFPNDAIITIDDDVIYDFTVLENLIKAYQKNSKNIYFSRGHRLKLKNKTEFLPYNHVIYRIKDQNVHSNNFPIGVGGILYPPNSLSEEVFNEEIFMQISPFADDLWFKAMALLNDTDCCKVNTNENSFNEIYLENKSVQDVPLGNINNGEKMNDIQLKAIFDKYNLYNKCIL